MSRKAGQSSRQKKKRVVEILQILVDQEAENASQKQKWLERLVAHQLHQPSKAP